MNESIDKIKAIVTDMNKTIIEYSDKTKSIERISEVINLRFQVRESNEELEKLDNALIKAGYFRSDGSPDRAGWYRECKRKLLKGE